MSRRSVPVAVAVVALAVAGCGDSGGDSGDLVVSAASSLSAAFPTYAESIRQDPKFSFAGSDELAAQIRSGATPDVYAAANTAYPEQLHDEGLVSDPVEFATNQLVIAVPHDSIFNSIEDLAGHGPAIAIGDPQVPVGSYTREVIDRLPAKQGEALLNTVKTEEPDVAGIIGKIQQGAVDAGFVYATDVVAAGEFMRAIELPEELQPEVVYGIAVVADAGNPERAREFVDGLLEPEGQQLLENAGFLPAP